MRKNNKTQSMGFSAPPPPSSKLRSIRPPETAMSERKIRSPAANCDLFHVIHKVPAVDRKDPSRAISLFWSAINAGDRVDSALKDMAVVMKQLNRVDEAIEAIRSFRHLCPYDSQESIDNVLVELYKRAGRTDEEIEMLQSKLKRIDEVLVFGGRKTRTARFQGKKVQITIEQEKSRILGNLAWIYLQQNNYKTAEEHYRKALLLEPDENKQCNLAICLMHTNRLKEAKSLLQAVKASSGNKPMDESYVKSYERAHQMLTEIEQQSLQHSFESMSQFSVKKQNLVDTVETEACPLCKKTYFSPAPSRHNLKDPFMEPRRYPWGFNDEDQRTERGSEVVGNSNRSFSFRQPMPTDNLQAHAVRNLESSFPAAPSEDSRRRLCGDIAHGKGDAVAQPVSPPGSWRNGGYPEIKGQARLEIASELVLNGNWRKSSSTWENSDVKNSSNFTVESAMLVDDTTALETSNYGESDQRNCSVENSHARQIITTTKSQKIHIQC
ncbi:hypothetical protein FNV43_RR10408 [Rhamnella rubrinervis]|uniref:Uncharacterized protein n=1 Tax=Rhamnella rubrinervis TaxID=2594499 RepID=A0A8K0MKU7_9ROSA|nr:hypothetical protein FNV43_RR10408 [Rhamnella rubrinervis]